VSTHNVVVEGLYDEVDAHLDRRERVAQGKVLEFMLLLWLL
jgi:hypothetical protein